MKANKSIIAAGFKSASVLLLLALQSCGTYNSKTSEIENDLLNGNFDNAIVNIDKNKFLHKDRNRLLYLMEKGKLEHLKGNYEGSNRLLEQAYIMIDDRIRTSAGQAIAGKFTNPMAEPYKGEDFEKVTVHYYKALNYFHLGKPDEALVEAKRINIKLLELNEKYKENKNKYTEDAFSQILQGILYESTGDINNAFIAYRNAEEIYNKDGGLFFGVPMPAQLKQDLLRTTRQLGFIQEHNQYLKKFNVTASAASQPTGEAIVFWENGLSPAKDQIVITASGGSGIFYGSYMDGDQLEEILIPIPFGTNIGSVNALAIPKYRKRENYYSKAAIVVNGKEQLFELGQDFYPIAKQCLKDRMLRETINLVVRFAAKKAGSAILGAIAEQALGDTAGDITKLGADVAGAVTEKADTRNWQSLPATISYARIPLKEGNNKFIIKKYGPLGIDTDTLSIPYRRGLQVVNYFDLGRTQVVPVVNRQKPGNHSAKDPALFIGSDAKSSTADIPVKAAQQPIVADPAAQAVIDKYIAAVGGAEKLRGVKTQYMRATTKTTVNGIATNSEILVKNSGSNSYSSVVTNGKAVMATLVNNEGIFTIDQNGKRTKVDSITTNAHIYTNLYDASAFPLKNGAVLDGVTNFDNQEAHSVSFTIKASGVLMTYYYSVKTGLALGYATLAGTAGTMEKSVTRFSDYRNINGVLFPFKLITESGNTTSEIIYTEVKFNQGVTDADFK